MANPFEIARRWWNGDIRNASVVLAKPELVILFQAVVSENTNFIDEALKIMDESEILQTAESDLDTKRKLSELELE